MLLRPCSVRTSTKFLVPLLVAPSLLAGSAHATANGSCFLTNLASCNQTLDGVVFSNFSFSGFTAAAGDKFNLLGDPLYGDAKLTFDPSRTTSITNARFSYTVTLASDTAFRVAQANINGSTLGGGSITTSFSSSGLIAPATATFNGPNVPGSFNQNLSTQTFTQAFTFNRVGSGDVFSQVGALWSTYQPVPGPLPLLGAATAFGLSRKIRSRIRSAE